jgi:hypothetical protein
MPDDDAPLTGPELRAYLESQDDFAFERRVFTHAKGFDLIVQHAGVYQDPMTSKVRQFDLRAYKANGNHRIRLAIECKSLRPTYPLLVSCVPRPPNEARYDVLFTRDEPGLTGSHAGARPMRTGFYSADESVGKDLCQVRRDPKAGFVATDEKLFDKYQQALASAADLIAAAADEHKPRRAVPLFTAILPVLVVPDGTLWAARYSSRGQLERDPEQANEVTFYLDREYPVGSTGLTFTISHLHIMTERSVTDLLRQVGQPSPNGIWQLLFQGAE